MQDAPKAVWSIPYVSVAFSASLKQNFIAYRSSKVSDCIFEIHQLWQSGFSRVYSNCCCSCWFEPEIRKIGRSSHKMYSNNILNFQESTTILNSCTKCLETYWRHLVFDTPLYYHIQCFYPSSLYRIFFKGISQVWHETPKGGWRMYQDCDYNNKDEVNSLNILSDNNSYLMFIFKQIYFTHRWD